MTTLDAALERIVAAAQPDRVILFGSAARGTAGPHSDLDFLVIKRGLTSRRQLAQTISRALVGIRASVDVPGALDSRWSCSVCIVLAY